MTESQPQLPNRFLEVGGDVPLFQVVGVAAPAPRLLAIEKAGLMTRRSELVELENQGFHGSGRWGE
jgi:hypothetical protein